MSEPSPHGNGLPGNWEIFNLKPPPSRPMPKGQRPLPLQTMSPPSLTDMLPVPCNHPASFRDYRKHLRQIRPPRSYGTCPISGGRRIRHEPSHICPGIHKKVSHSEEQERDSGTFRTGSDPSYPDQVFCRTLFLSDFLRDFFSPEESDSHKMAFRKSPTISGS